MDDQNQPVNQPINQPVTPAPIYQESQEKNAKWLWFLIILIIIGALAFAFFRGIGPFAAISPFAKSSSPTPSPIAESSPVVESSPSPLTSVDRSQAKLRILNGSGVTGKASATKDFLEKLGWKVSSIGNADSDTYTDTEILVNDNGAKFQDTMIKDLSDKYSAKAGSKSLDASSSADIEVIVGSK